MAMVRNNTARVIGLGGAANLLPGVNEVDDEAWKKAQTVALKALLTKQEGEDKPALELVSSAEATTATTAGATTGTTDTGGTGTLSSKNVTDAKALVAETYDRKLLERWRTEETRHTVQQAIDEQLAKLQLSESEKKRR
jgi:hypothetical protein